MTSGLSTRYDLGWKRHDVGCLVNDKPISQGSAQVTLYDLYIGRPRSLYSARGE